MEDFIIIAIVAVLVLVGIASSVKHFKGKSGCCGGGNTYVSKKKLKKVVAKKVFIVEGMTCENCKARVERTINDMEGLKAKVNLKKGEVVVSMEREAGEEEIIAAIEKAGYRVR